MGTTLFTLFLFGCPFLVCFIFWHTIKALIKRFGSKESETDTTGCLSVFIMLAMCVLFFVLLIAINNNFSITKTVDRDKDGKIECTTTRHFSLFDSESEESGCHRKLVNKSDIPIYIYSESYSAMAVFITKPQPTYTVVCAPGQTIPLHMSIDYYFEPAPESIQVKSETGYKVCWVMDSVVPYDYIIPIAPDSPVITQGDKKQEEEK